MGFCFPTTPAVTTSTVVTLAGDVTGPSNANTVTKIRNRAVSSAAPSTGQALVWDGSQWIPGTAAASGGTDLAGQTLWGSPVIGEVGYVSGNATLAKAQANSAATALSVIGAYQGTAGTVRVSGPALMLFEAGLTLVAGQPIYLSATVAGRVTNVEPSGSGQYSVLLATLDSAAGYNAGAGSAQPCTLGQYTIGGPF